MKYLLGNIPAFDVLKLRDNEGLDLEKRLDLCFAGKLKDLLAATCITDLVHSIW